VDLVAWLIVADALATAARRRPDGPRTGARLAVVSLGVLAASILWGVLGPSRHGLPPAEPAPMSREAVP
jgi:cytochrome b